jgi:NADH:ubiquinone oxidoreductase subunit 2 (subunit N)
VVGRAAFGTWAAGVRLAFSTGRIDHVRGWARRSPILAVALALVAAAAVGFPGLLAFDSRAALVDVALGGPLATVVLVATLLPILYYGRLFVVGLSRADAIEPRATVPATGPRTPIAGRPFAAAVIAVLLGCVALSTAAGAFGLADAAGAVPSAPHGPVQPVEP